MVNLESSLIARLAVFCALAPSVHNADNNTRYFFNETGFNNCKKDSYKQAHNDSV